MRSFLIFIYFGLILVSNVHAVDYLTNNWTYLDDYQIKSSDRFDPIGKYGEYSKLQDNLKIRLSDLGSKSITFRNQNLKMEMFGVEIKDGNKIYRIVNEGRVNLNQHLVYTDYWDNDVVAFTLMTSHIEPLHNTFNLEETLYIFNRKTKSFLKRVILDDNLALKPNKNEYQIGLLDQLNSDGYSVDSRKGTYSLKGYILHSKETSNGQTLHTKEPYSFTLKLDSNNLYGIKCVQASDDCNNFGSEKAIPVN